MSEENSYSFENEFTLQVQEKILSLLIFESEWAKLDGLEIIKPEYFENKSLKAICTWIRRYYESMKDTPTKDVLLQEALDYVNKYNLPDKDYYTLKEKIENIYYLEESNDTEYFKQKAIDFVRQIEWKKALARGGECFKKGNFEAAVNAFKSILSIGSETNLGIDLSEEKDGNRIIDAIKDSYDPDKMIKTGIEALDKALGGGLVKNSLSLFAATSGGGKSKFLSFLTKECLKRNKRVIYISLELTEEETMQNILTSITGYTLGELMQENYRILFNNQLQKFRNAYSDNVIVKFYKPNAITADTIHNFIQKVINVKKNKGQLNWRPDIIILDYMDKMLPVDRVKNASIYETGANVASDCKNLAITFECPVVTGSQVGRSAWNLTGDEVVSIASVAESAAKIHLCHNFVSFNQNPNEKEKGLSRFYVGKARSGQTGKLIYMEHNLSRNNFKEHEPWTQESLKGTVPQTVKDTTSK